MRLHLLLAVALVLTAPTIARGQLADGAEDPPSADSPEEREALAKQRYAEGDAHYAAGRYDKAVVSFTQAFELSGKIVLLFNIANALERNGDYQAAADHLRRYAAAPEAADVSSINERIKRLEMNAEEKRRRASEDARREAKEPPIDPRQTPPPVTAAPVRRPLPSPEVDRPSRVPGWALVGVGAALLGGGVVTGIVARQTGDDARESCSDDGVCLDTASSDLDRERNLGIVADVSMGLGVISAALGIYLVIRAGRTDTSAVTVGPTRDGAAVTYLRRF